MNDRGTHEALALELRADRPGEAEAPARPEECARTRITVASGCRNETTLKEVCLAPSGGTRTASPKKRVRCLPTRQTVLLVGDMPMMREAMARVLREIGFRVLVAPTHRAAQRQARIHPEIQMLLLALPLAESTGLEFAFWFRAHYPAAQVLITSSFPWDLGLRLNGEPQMSLLREPFTRVELARTMRQLLQ